jgi:hypothetical protein
MRKYHLVAPLPAHAKAWLLGDGLGASPCLVLYVE